MKKIVILSFYSGFIDRGAEIWVRLLQTELSGRFDVGVVSGTKGGSIFLNGITNLRKWWKADVVIPINGRIQSFICRIVTFITGKKMVVFGHSGPGFDDRFNLLCSPNVFVAFSTFQRDWADKHRFPWTKVIMIPHAVDTEMFKPGKEKEKKNLVLCVAANTPDKRVDLVRKAVEKIPGVEFMAVGKGNEYEYSYDEMPGVYRQAKVFCFVPKSHEAFGLVFLEAMASNLPVVTINDPTRREIVGDAGMFVSNPENVEELAGIISNALKTKWGNKPRKQADKFSWEKIVKMYENLFESV